MSVKLPNNHRGGGERDYPSRRPPEPGQRYGLVIDELCDRLGITQRILVQQFGMTSTEVSNWRNGKRVITGPGLMKLMTLANMNGLDLVAMERALG